MTSLTQLTSSCRRSSLIHVAALPHSFITFQNPNPTPSSSHPKTQPATTYTQYLHLPKNKLIRQPSMNAQHHARSWNASRSKPEEASPRREQCHVVSRLIREHLTKPMQPSSQNSHIR
ncbi:hypothetical protein BDW42DRAFT_163093 [Aspergillus taichungensis]|uniref:Uncharacterized protein n=1 Tax=Aspergillus taichungensis TaxID=482145 RepID=A0A2J5I2U9_9EURO|nr:hypothetical protein BDW42DRAFT_163093 [Aspergillus taichungensis]